MQILRQNDLVIRAAGEGKIAGTAAVYYRDGDSGTEYAILPGANGVRERIAYGAFDRAISSGSDVAALYNHNKDKVLGRQSNGTLKLWSDPIGLHYELQLDMRQQWHKDLYYSIERGDVKGTSFSGHFAHAPFSKDKHGNVRTIERMADLIEISPCVFPAYTGTQTQIRSAETAQIEAEYRTWLLLEKSRNRKK